MAAKRRVKRLIRKLPVAVTVTLAIIFIVYAALSYVDYHEVDIGFDIDLGGANLFRLGGDNGEETEEKQTLEKVEVPVPEDGQVMFHFIDVGQGDAILVTTPDGNMLIDTSIKAVREDLVNYLDAAGVKELEYLVLTHPDADHIGNADYIIENYDVKNILLPDCVSSSKTYERMIDAMEKSDAKVMVPEVGYTFKLGALVNTVIAPLKEYDDPNEMSIVIKSVFGETSVMLTGDAEVESEGDIVATWNKADLDCDILKIGHHGSRTSTTDDFLAAVSPEIAIISCGEGNSYGHPHEETVQKLDEEKIPLYRTDDYGDIVIITDGKTYEVITENKIDK